MPDSSLISTISVSTVSQILALQVWRQSCLFDIANMAFIHLTSDRSMARTQALCLRAALSSPAPPFARNLFVSLEADASANLIVLHSIESFESVHVSAPNIHDALPLQFSQITRTDDYFPSFSSLQHLEIQTSILFSPSYISWTPQALRSPSLHTIDLGRLALPAPHQWAELLHALDIPSLRCFSVTADAPRAVHVAAFQ